MNELLLRVCKKLELDLFLPTDSDTLIRCIELKVDYLLERNKVLEKGNKKDKIKVFIEETPSTAFIHHQFEQLDYTEGYENHNYYTAGFLKAYEIFFKDEYEEIKKLTNTLFDEIKHGDEKHQQWLKTAIDNHFNGMTIPKAD